MQPNLNSFPYGYILNPSVECVLCHYGGWSGEAVVGNGSSSRCPSLRALRWWKHNIWEEGSCRSQKLTGHRELYGPRRHLFPYFLWSPILPFLCILLGVCKLHFPDSLAGWISIKFGGAGSWLESGRLRGRTSFLLPAHLPGSRGPLVL